jgi:AmmeMemoRadiSam system protein B
MDFATLAENDNKACGLIPIKIVLTLASWFNWSPQLLHYSHSGETSGDHGRVVGYTTIGFYSEEDTDVQ